MKFSRWVALSLALLLAPPFARAWPPTAGAEFEFVDDDIMTHWDDPGGEDNGFSKGRVYEKAALNKLGAAVIAQCKVAGCVVEKVSHKFGDAYLVKYKDGFWFRVSFDPGCVEVQTRPSTLEELTKWHDRLENDLFATAKKAGLYPELEYGTGAGHFNFGARETFGDDAGLFLAFFADFANHPELSLGALGYDLDNAPPMTHLKPEQREAFHKILKAYEAGEIKSIKAAATRIQREVYTSSFKPGNAGLHYQAVSMKYIVQRDFPKEDQPLEIRSMFPQRNADDFIRMLELVQLRVAFLRDNKAKPVYLAPTRQEYTPREIVSRYYKYVVEAGGDWEKFHILLPEELEDVEPYGILTGEINWKKADFVEGVKYFLGDAPYSPWVRGKILEAVLGDAAHDPAQYLRIFVDFAQHPELADAWAARSGAAPGRGEMTAQQRATAERLLADAAAGKVASVAEASRRLREEVFGRKAGEHGPSTGATFETLLGWSDLANGNHEELARVANLIRLRAAYLKAHPEAAIGIPSPAEKKAVPRDRVSRFYEYVVEAGGDWGYFRKLLAPDLLGLEPHPVLKGEGSWGDVELSHGLDFVSRDLETSPWLRGKVLPLLKKSAAMHSEDARRFISGLLRRASSLPGGLSAQHETEKLVADTLHAWVAQGGQDAVAALEHQLRAAGDPELAGFVSGLAVPAAEECLAKKLVEFGERH